MGCFEELSLVLWYVDASVLDGVEEFVDCCVYLVELVEVFVGEVGAGQELRIIMASPSSFRWSW